MCLNVDEEKTKTMGDRTGELTVWKVYRVGMDGVLHSPVRDRHTAVNHGTITSDRTTRESGQDLYDERYGYGGCLEVRRGIHVLLTREAARIYKRDLTYDWSARRFVIIRCKATMADFVATGSTYYFAFAPREKSAVFMKIHISKTDWKKGLHGDFR